MIWSNISPNWQPNNKKLQRLKNLTKIYRFKRQSCMMKIWPFKKIIKIWRRRIQSLLLLSRRSSRTSC